MKCANCGSEMKVGSVYCSVCGHEMQIVPDYNSVEDPAYQEQQELEAQNKKRIEQQKRMEEEQARLEEEARKKKQRKKRLRNALLIVIFFVLLVGGIGYYTHYTLVHDYDYQIKKATEAYQDGRYKKGIAHASNALAVDAESIDAAYLMARCELGCDNSEEALDVLRDIADTEENDTNDYTYTMKDIYRLYAYICNDTNDYDSLLLLAESTSKESLLKILSKYLVDAPEFSLEAGSYAGDTEIELTCDTSGVTIYYTLDGSEPTKDSTKYKDPISLDEGETTITAVAYTASGKRSLYVEAVYSISVKAPDAPTVTPASGTYTDETMITIDVPDDCTAYYTWDGTTPTATNGKKYSGPFEMESGNNILSVVVVDQNSLTSKVVTRSYTYLYNDSDDEDTLDEE